MRGIDCIFHLFMGKLDTASHKMLKKESIGSEDNE